MPNLQVNGPQIEDMVVEGEAIPLQQDEQSLQTQSCLNRIKPHITYIQNYIRTLSQEHGRCPEKQWLSSVNGRAIVTIPLPDRIPIPNFNL